MSDPTVSHTTSRPPSRAGSDAAASRPNQLSTLANRAAPEPGGAVDRRAFLLGAIAAASVPACVRAEAERAIDQDDLDAAARLLGLDLTAAERKLMAPDVARLQDGVARLRQVPIDNAVAPALTFRPLAPTTSRPAAVVEHSDATSRTDSRTADSWTGAPDDIAFAPAHELAAALRDGRTTSVELTELYLQRMRRLDPLLEAVITRTEDRALEAATLADRALADGRSVGPLHGVPWGAKDLLAVAGAPTTWGTEPFREQTFDADAFVVERLDAAGAPLLAKLTLGELAWGDVWFGGKTRNPWNPEQGSSGSSAGSAAAVSAGLVGFAIGTETLGSIVSPCTRTGATGLRPTFGRVSRRGAMALAWSLDKIGPIARDVEDCALIFEAIAGADAQDPSTLGAVPFRHRRDLDPGRLRVGVVRSAFDAEPDDLEWAAHDRASLALLEEIGCDLVDIDLPSATDDSLPVEPLAAILTAEAATAFEALSLAGLDDRMKRQERDAWPNVLRTGQLVSAVHYLQANRIRRRLMEEVRHLMAPLDLFIAPTFGADSLLLTNLTGHPALVLPNGFRRDGTPTSMTLTGRIGGEAALVALGNEMQRRTDFHRRRPPLERFLAARTAGSPPAAT
ncbi:MAG: amidase [Acidobacteriota bacterium]